MGEPSLGGSLFSTSFFSGDVLGKALFGRVSLLGLTLLENSSKKDG